MHDHPLPTPGTHGKGHSGAIRLDDELGDDGEFGSVFSGCCHFRFIAAHEFRAIDIVITSSLMFHVAKKTGLESLSADKRQ